MFDIGFNIWGIVSTGMNLLLGGSLLWVFTIGSHRRKANSEAKGAEIENMQEVIGSWKDLIVGLQAELDRLRAQNAEMQVQINALTKEVVQLRATSNRVLCKLNKMTKESYDDVVEQIKKVIQEG